MTERRTDRQTDGIAIASKALAMRALRHAVESAKIRMCPPRFPAGCCRQQLNRALISGAYFVL